MKRFILILTISLWTPTSYAASWYVDNAVSKSGNGQSWTTAWKNFSNITGVTSGDTIYISGGTTSNKYSEQLTLSWNGVTVSPGGAESSPDPKHSGTVIINSGTPYGIYINGNDITVDGNAGGTQKIKILNSDRGVNVESHTGITIRYVEASGNIYGIYFNGSKGEIDHNYIHDLSISAGDAGIRFLNSSCVGADFSWGLIHDNIIVVTKQATGGIGIDGMQVTCAATIYNNKISSVIGTYTYNQHADAVQTSGPYIKLYNNEITGFPNYGFYLEYTNDHAYVYNNYFYNCRGAVIIGGRNANLNEVRIDNNTIIDWSGDVQAAINPNNTGYAMTNSSIRNNIIINNKGGAIAVNTTSTCGTDILIDNNVTVSGSQGSNAVTCNEVTYTQPTYSSTTQPTFVSYIEFAGASNNMHLASIDTIAQDHGATLSTWFTKDKQGVSRPQGPAWDIGAYEFTGKRFSSPIPIQ